MPKSVEDRYDYTEEGDARRTDGSDFFPVSCEVVISVHNFLAVVKFAEDVAWHSSPGLLKSINW
jgi:hypothetical protein